MKLAIKGNPKRSKEVIEILEMLGGVNKHYIINTEENLLYCLREIDNVIIATYPNNSITVFTLEEFLEKFPYKVGDKVSSKYLKNYKIEKMEWEDTNNRVIYKLQGMGWYSAEELQPYKEETMDKANKVVFDTNAHCCDIMNHLIKEESMEEIIKISIPKGYEFAGVDDVNQQVVFEKIGYQYPKTYEECWYMLKHDINNDKVTGYKNNILSSLQKLLICRDAYWKIAGEQMGLGKSWEPDWTNVEQDKYVLFTNNNAICSNRFVLGHNVLAFPTEEMRDAFYENFKETIEQCKELL